MKLFFLLFRQYEFPAAPEINGHFEMMIQSKGYRRMLSYTREIVRSKDYDGYLCGLLWPSSSRDGFFAVKAWNAEMATIRETVQGNAMTGKLRYQWWRESIGDIYNNTWSNTHPILSPLAKTIKKYGLTQRYLQRCIDAREKELEGNTIKSMMELEQVVEHTHASLMYLNLELLGIRNDIADQAARSIGIYVGLVTILRGTAFHLQNRQLYIPTELLNKYTVGAESLYASGKDPSSECTAIQKMVSEYVSHTKTHLEEARSVQHELPATTSLAFLAAVSPTRYLGRLTEQKMHLMHPSVLVSPAPFRYQCQLLRHRLFNSY